jgi:fructosamine-3-kinase
VITETGATVVVKHGATIAADQFAKEAAGLAAIGATGVRVPEVLDVAEDWLILEDIPNDNTVSPDWEAVGRALATMHRTTAPAFGFDTDTYIGTVPRSNRRDPDGHRFFAEQRLLAPLEWPGLSTILEPADRRGIERLAGRLHEFVPEMPAALTHGDFWLDQSEGSWFGNILFPLTGAPVMIDPAVSHVWAEVDLANFTVYIPEIPEPMWRAYREINPLPDGTRERLPLIQVHDRLQIIEHTDSWPEFRLSSLRAIRDAIARFA